MDMPTIDENKPEIKLNGAKPLAKGANTLIHSASNIVNKVRDVSEDAVKESVSFVKRYPIHTALSAAAVGFVAGFLLKSARKARD